MLTDPVADYLTRIRNAIQKRFDTVDMPKSNFKVEISKILKQEGYIVDFENAKDQKKPTLRIKLKYKDGLSVISGLDRVSRPGRRIYSSSERVPKVLNGLGIAVVSTSKGLMTDRKARQEGLGGEIVCTVW
ncbi:MAG TPA: 30S ribosomal protein S8 [Candidatus Aminicenantes bacterium]|nr:30S ribosomal protein S8 [Candidatus Aminicenantes bacterium]HPT00448.1 30S ribosomal protein S8 [Candidatus Aminicenantes bacterium]